MILQPRGCLQGRMNQHSPHAMPDCHAHHHKALRLIILLNLPCLVLVLVMMSVSHQKAAQTAAASAAFAPLEARVRDLIESERDIEKLRGMARLENIGASGSMQTLQHISKASPTTLLPGALIPLVSILVAGVSLHKSRPAVAPGPPRQPSL